MQYFYELARWCWRISFVLLCVLCWELWQQNEFKRELLNKFVEHNIIQDSVIYKQQKTILIINDYTAHNYPIQIIKREKK